MPNNINTAPLTAERRAQIIAEADKPAHENAYLNEYGAALDAVDELLAEVERLTARVKQQQDELGSQEAQMLELVKELQSAKPLAHLVGDAIHDLQNGPNLTQNNVTWVQVLRARQLLLAVMNHPLATPGAGWVAVSERLPEDPSYCIVVDERRQVHELEFNGGHWWTEQADAPMPADAFTHWLPIPNAPKPIPAP